MEVKQMREELKAAGVKVVPRKNDDVVKMYNKRFAGKDITSVAYTDDHPKTNVVSIEKGLATSEVNNPASFKAEIGTIPADNMYTYIGAGDEPPHQIKFMGIQVFTRGQATEVTNALILSKIDNNRCFVKGSVDADAMYDADQEAKKKADLQREEDVKIQIEAERKQRKA